jgi:hypothetical protein
MLLGLEESNQDLLREGVLCSSRNYLFTLMFRNGDHVAVVSNSIVLGLIRLPVHSI